jgi:CHAT domain-containing protein/tetratricopeptide (TPR) repeat protein
MGEAIYQLLNLSNPKQVAKLLRDYSWLTSAEVDEKLTRIIAKKRRENMWEGIAIYTAARGFLRRCRLDGVAVALDTQSGWPLSTKRPLTQLLGLEGTASADLRIRWAAIALRDVELATEPDIYGLICYNLGLGYQAKADTGITEAFAIAIKYFEVAMRAWQSEDSKLARVFLGRAQHNLGYLYLQQPGENRSQSVEQALELLQRAQKSFATNAAEQIDVCLQMGNAYLGRIENERLHNLEIGIDCYKKAYDLAERNNHPNRLGEIEHNLAVAYRIRLKERRADNYEQAREYAEKALSCFGRQTNPEDWARTTAELATIYAHRLVGDRADNLERAIKYAEQALKIYSPDTHPRQWALVQLNLGNIYCDRMKGSPRDNNHLAIACFEAVRRQRQRETDPLGWAEVVNNMGTAYAALSVSPGDLNYRKAVDCFRQALRVNQPRILPARSRRTAANWGNLAFRFGRWAEALAAFQKAFVAGEALYQVSSTESGRRVELAESAGLAAKAAFCLIKLNRPAEALLQLEQGKTRLLAEALALGDVDLAMLPGPQRQAIEVARQEVRKLEAEMRLPPDTPARRSDIKLAEELRQARANLTQIITDIRQTNANFMPTGLTKLDDLLQLIPVGGALVAPLVTLQGSAVFVLPYGTELAMVDGCMSLLKFSKPTPTLKCPQVECIVHLKDFTEQTLNDLLIGSESKPGWLRVYANGLSHDWLAAIETFTGQLWDKLMGPIHDRLVDLGLVKDAPIILMPQGGLGLLPLHAAWREVGGVKRAFLDDYTVTYAPSGYALSVSQRRLKEPQRQQRSLLTVINPSGDLPFTPVEGEAVATLFDPASRQTLVEEQATLERVIKEIPERAYLHFSCHGTYNWQEILNSGLYLADNKRKPSLTLAKIISDLNLSAVHLVTLSACETGLTEFEQTPDEYIGLPAGFLQAGAPGVISSLWAVDDFSTSLLIGRFYQYHLHDKLQPAVALRQAQKWLRSEITWGEMSSYLPYLEQALLSLEQQEAKANNRSLMQLRTKRRALESELKTIQEGLAKHGANSRVSRFSEPYYWAAFTMIGVGTNEH